ncbi:hypothetical protein FF011L_32140 [Roseimaritima multifibrata]|uniref:Uncharacterized protein n=1 Tax=Roseimaritima multifibrata TaxID=1930274 RepID=A0A517MHS5_9BACT|nr:hypothetical protein FF011L_32140 [Roseimaritima multifibrata]
MHRCRSRSFIRDRHRLSGDSFFLFFRDGFQIWLQLVFLTTKWFSLGTTARLPSRRVSRQRMVGVRVGSGGGRGNFANITQY